MHLTIRVAWHDNRWNGTICRAPSANSFCIALDRIRAAPRDDEKEDRLAGTPWCELASGDLPPCQAEAGAFMSPREWIREVNHPYRGSNKTRDTHGHLLPTPITASAYSTFAVPFWWMLRKNQEEVESRQAEPLPTDEKAPFRTPWVFGRARQEALTELFFNRLDAEHSLVFFYTKEGHPLGDDIVRLVVGAGEVENVGQLRHYDSSDASKPTHPLWDRPIHHSIRPDGNQGFLLPYHDYLTPTGDPDEDARRARLLREIAVVPPMDHIREFSYMSELVSADVALSTLTACLDVVRRIKAHGIASGPWDAREEWLNAQLAANWRERGAFPGLGSALEALGLRLGTSLAWDLFETDTVAFGEDPWPTVDAILRAQASPPSPAYRGDVAATAKTWLSLPNERRELLKLLSRFDLTPNQATRWFNADKRPVPLVDTDILSNPYRLSEVDLGDETDGPVSIGVTDRGLLPDATIAARHPVPEPSRVESWQDARRVRAAIVAVLRAAADSGDTLLSVPELMEHVECLDLSHDCVVTRDWLQAHIDELAEAVVQFDITMPAPTEQDPDHEDVVGAVQLTDLQKREDRLGKILQARASRPLPSTKVEWEKLIVKAIAARGGSGYDPTNDRHRDALEEQAIALERITTRKLSALVGRAGTGKTSALGALLLCEPIAKDGILLLAPTGKARVLLGKASGGNAMTVAQFLYHQKRYDGPRQRPLFTGGEKYHKERTIVIDESSMLTMDDLYAVLEALDPVHVQRIILVGDPNQLPPIGVGRPFADLVGALEMAQGSEDSKQETLAGALGKLTVEVRSAAADTSSTLSLASWFTREQQPANADRVFSDLELGGDFTDLEIRYWKTPEDLEQELFDAFQAHLGLDSPDDIEGFDRAMGLTENRWVPYDDPKGAESFQILSPVRMHPYGIYALNRCIQAQFRGPELNRARHDRYNRHTKLGDEEIVIRDKVIQLKNERRGAYRADDGAKERLYLANGEVGICTTDKHGYLNVIFSQRPGYTLGYSERDFPSGSGPLELAYALTIHKSQGSEFKNVFVIVPRHCCLLSRELLYTALTRSREQLVLLIEGDDASLLYDYTRPERSETVSRNTNLFFGSVRTEAETVPFAEHLIHRTLAGHMVRSKSELVIANMLHTMGIAYQYEPRYEGLIEPGIRRPDFMFHDYAGDPIIWEHLGMLVREHYRRSWEEKRKWYMKNGFIEGETLFTTEDDPIGGLDSTEVRAVAEQIKARV